MQIVRTTELKPGQTLRRAIYSRIGQRLLAPGVKLTEQMLSALEARRGGVYVDEALEQVETRPGPGGAVSARAGVDVRSHYQQVIARVRAGQEGDGARDVARRKARVRRRAEDVVAARLPRWEGAPKRVPPAPDCVPMNDRAVAGFPQGRALARMRAERLRVTETLLSRLVEGGGGVAEDARELVEELMDQACRHAPVYPRVIGGEGAGEEGLSDHMLATASLAVAMSARLGWSRPDVTAAGLAGLFADAGMALLDEQVRASERPLDDVARNRVRRHPAWSVALLEEVSGLPLSVRLGVHQHHEREDGSGYPRGLRGVWIHDVAKVVAVADAYAAAISERPYRSRATGFAVMRGLVGEARSGRLWRDAVRALIQTVGLFPVGSFVRLSDGRIGEVAAAGGAARAARPVVRVWRQERSGDVTPGEVIDLCAPAWAHVRISGEVASSGLARARAREPALLVAA